MRWCFNLYNKYLFFTWWTIFDFLSSLTFFGIMVILYSKFIRKRLLFQIVFCVENFNFSSCLFWSGITYRIIIYPVIDILVRKYFTHQCIISVWLPSRAVLLLHLEFSCFFAHVSLAYRKFDARMHPQGMHTCDLTSQPSAAVVVNGGGGGRGGGIEIEFC